VTPQQRIRRIQRWLRRIEGTEFNTPCTVACVPFSEFSDEPTLSKRLQKADRLFAAELAWLCEYATRNQPYTEADPSRAILWKDLY